MNSSIADAAKRSGGNSDINVGSHEKTVSYNARGHRKRRGQEPYRHGPALVKVGKITHTLKLRASGLIQD